MNAEDEDNNTTSWRSTAGDVGKVLLILFAILFLLVLLGFAK